VKGKSEGEGNEGNLKRERERERERETLGFMEGAGKTGGKGIYTLVTDNFFEFPFLQYSNCLLV